MATMNQHPVLSTYLNAIDGHDLGALLALVSPDVTLILPQGQLVAGKDEFETFHREWFADPDWKLQADLVRSHATEKAASFVLNVVYLDKDRAGNPISYTYFLCLTFVRTEGRWLLVLDQNTPIVP